MKCKNHTTDLTSTIGVCASCLREQLHKLILAEEQAQAQAQAQSQAHNHNNHNRNYPNPYPKFPPSDIHHQKSNNSMNNKPRLNHSLSDQRFYNSPQIALNNTKGCIGTNYSSNNNKKKSFIRFSSFSNLFRSNGEGDANSNHRRSVSTSGEPSGAAGKPTSVTSSPLWFSNAPPRTVDRRKNKSVQVRDRGMSPVKNSDDEVSDGTDDEFSESCKQTPKKTPVRRGGGGQRSVTELIFCLSPLVRASPSRLWSMKGKPPVDGGFSGDGRFSGVPHLSNVKSLCANRSRKLADFGRGGRNR